MAFSEAPVVVSRISETTLTTSNLYQVAWLTTGSGGQGYVLIGDPGTTAGNRPFGIYYGGGGRSTSTHTEAVSVAIGGLVKARFIASATQAPGQYVIATSSGYVGGTPSTNYWVIGQVVQSATGGGIGTIKMVSVPFKFIASMITAT